MPAGNGTIDFGAFPGGSDATLTITGQGAILATSRVEAWIEPKATTDHSADEHMVETIKAFADQSSIVVGTGFTIRAFNTSQMNEPVNIIAGRSGDSVGGIGTRIYGKWNVAWAWV